MKQVAKPKVARTPKSAKASAPGSHLPSLEQNYRPLLSPRWEISPDLAKKLSDDLDVESLRAIDFVTVRVMRLAQLMNRHARDGLAEQFDLSVAEWRCLASLGDVGPLTAAQICRLTDADKGHISGALKTLDGKGLVETAAVVGKSILLKLTPAGSKLFLRSVALRRVEEKRLLSLLTVKQRLVLYESLAALATSYDEHSPSLDQ
jgi:DNA-binding MarR family transcriptional regulator